MKLAHKVIAKVIGKNLKSTPPEVIAEQLLEQRPLPMGRKEFDEWSERIISGALIPMATYEAIPGLDTPVLAKANQEEKQKIFYESQKFALANALMHLGPTESHKPDAFFIHSLRKFAINQVADTVRKELHAAAKARTEADEAAQKASGEDTKG